MIKTCVQFGSDQVLIEKGKVAKQAESAVWVRVNGTVILVTVTFSTDIPENQSFFPLTVDYREKLYAVGRIPGGFFKRENRPRDHETLTSRLIDRSLRPMFSEDLYTPLQINAQVFASDLKYDLGILSILGASVALGLSSVPFDGPVTAVSVGRIDGEYVINPSIEQLKKSTLELVVSGNIDGITMIESKACEIAEDDMLDAVKFAHEYIVRTCKEQSMLFEQHPQKKYTPVIKECVELKTAIEKVAQKKISDVLTVSPDANSFSQLSRVILDELSDVFTDQSNQKKVIVEKLVKHAIRQNILNNNIRPDGRTITDVRPISSDVSVLPQVHGSALFTRGQTQSLGVTTLGFGNDKQIIDGLNEEYKDRFMLHYNFPGYATGEVKRERSPGRREIGHGALAKKALEPLLPSEEDFPYTIRIVSEILESNGSSSMASVCAGSLSLFDAGVPIKKACVGIAMGLISDLSDPDNQKFTVLTDILGFEDHCGDMDLKVAGSKDGLTALQLDLKLKSIPLSVLKDALYQSKDGRRVIMDNMNATLSMPRENISSFVPQIVSFMVPVEKIGMIIGSAGKNVKKIAKEQEVEINIDDDGKISVSGKDRKQINVAVDIIKSYSQEAEPGKRYSGIITKIVDFGVFVEILPKKEGLVHISNLGLPRGEKIQKKFFKGESIIVECIKIDDRGRVDLKKVG